MLTVPQMYSFGSNRDQSGRNPTDSPAGFGSSTTYNKAWGKLSPWGRAGALVDLGEGKCPLSYSLSSPSLNYEPLPC